MMPPLRLRMKANTDKRMQQNPRIEGKRTAICGSSGSLSAQRSSRKKGGGKASTTRRRASHIPEIVGRRTIASVTISSVQKGLDSALKTATAAQYRTKAPHP